MVLKLIRGVPQAPYPHIAVRQRDALTISYMALAQHEEQRLPMEAPAPSGRISRIVTLDPFVRSTEDKLRTGESQP